MRRGNPNHQLVKKHRNYSVHEIAFLFGMHKNTVREWIRVGLPCIEGRPVLILGCDLIAFLRARRAKKRRSCRPGQMYCLRCREPRFPAGGLTDFAPINDKLGNLIGICPVCEGVMHRCVSMSKIEEIRKTMEVSFSQALPHLNEIYDPSLNSDLR